MVRDFSCTYLLCEVYKAKSNSGLPRDYAIWQSRLFVQRCKIEIILDHPSSFVQLLPQRSWYTMFTTRAAAEDAAINGTGREWDSQECRKFQSEVLSVRRDQRASASYRVCTSLNLK